jgi:hypothetical protein
VVEVMSGLIVSVAATASAGTIRSERNRGSVAGPARERRSIETLHLAVDSSAAGHPV